MLYWPVVEVDPANPWLEAYRRWPGKHQSPFLGWHL